MTNHEWQKIVKIRDSFKNYCIKSLQFFGEEYTLPSVLPNNSQSLLKTSIRKSVVDDS